MTKPESALDDAAADPSTLFALLSDDIRLAIVRELAMATEAGSAAGLSFSDLRCRVGVSDSGQFNYHLHRLRGRLVEKSDGGYVLTPAGRQAAVAIGALD